MNNFRILGIFILLLPSLSSAETHNEVQAALDYQLPENTCTKPKAFVRSSEVVGSPLQDTGSISFQGSGPREVTDMDSGTIRRLERKEERWHMCVSDFKTELLNDLGRLKACAQYGVTQDQANIILGKMAQIQKVYMTADGVIEETEESPEG